MTNPSLVAELRDLVAQDPAFAAARRALARGGRAVAQGVPGGARPALLAALALERPLLVVVPAEDELPGLADDLAGFLEGTGKGEVLRNPSLDLLEDEGDDDDARATRTLGERMRVLYSLDLARGQARPALVLSGATALLQRLPGPERAARGVVELRQGATVDPQALALDLVRTGHVRVPLVEAPGEFAIRGGILDLFPLGAALPVRVELFGDEVESLRRFEPGSQRSIEELTSWSLPLVAAEDYVRQRREDGSNLLDHLPADAAVVLVEPGRCRERLEQATRRFATRAADLVDPAVLLEALSARPTLLLGEPGPDEPLARGAAAVDFSFAPPDLHAGPDLQSLTNALAGLVRRGEQVTLAAGTDAEAERLVELLRQSALPVEPGTGLRRPPLAPGVTVVVAGLEDGLRLPARGLTVLVSHRLFAQHRRAEAGPRVRRRRGVSQTVVESFADLEVGDPVVHVAHGIALFQGIVRREREGQPRDFLQLEFDGGTLYVPTDRIGLVRRYVGPTGRTPKLSKLGGKGWKAQTKKASEAVHDLAAELLEVQAERAARPGFAFPPDDRWQALFEESFPYTDTEDQARITVEIKQDMQLPRAMDRLVCGDVGYGKTELAIRAAFKCANAGRQVAVLAPTTVLAHQHHRTFSERMAAYPLRVEVVSRFLTPGDQRRLIKAAAKGEVDILIGTHRLLSQDVAFRDLGLVVIDEEQRFGVAAKERLKSLRRMVDVLTLTATPIPRTLHLALSGARDISVLQTPPPGRTPVETRVVRASDGLIKRAIERELARDGQVFVVHDRVRSIEKLARRIRELVPTARVLIVHGQLPEEDIEDRMLRFFEHEADVLVATTLIENGLDVKRANTLLVDRADRYGLAELHQLRGRVGRSDVRAHAYMMVPEDRPLSDVARRRLRAIEEFSDLGAGFQIAMRDLEIRGAGNVLGAQQSGHIALVGYDLYCRMLKRAVAELRGELEKKPLDLERDLDLEASELEIVLDVPAYVPDAYVADVGLKIECYRKLATADDEAELEHLADELRDRYGPLPDVLVNLFKLRRVRIRAAGHGVLKIGRQDRVLQFRCRNADRVEAGVRARRGALRRIDTHMVYLVMPRPEAEDVVQLDLLLEVLAPVSAPTEPAAPLDREAVQRERQRRVRAKEARAERQKRPAKKRPRRLAR